MNRKANFRVLLVLLFALFFTSPSLAGTAVKVMTYNVDEGTDFSAIVSVLLNGGDFTTAVQQTIAEVESSHPEVRMQLIANAIAAAQPDIVGLQEAALWTLPTGDLDLLQLIEAALPDYEEAVVQPEFQINLTSFGVAFTDRDVILVRKGAFNSVFGSGGHYNALVPLSSTLLPGVSAITRGWASVDVTRNGTQFHFFTTHLEDGTNRSSPIFALVQALQEIELVSLAPIASPVIIGGDFNTVANNPTSPTYLTYLFMLGNGFTDAWRAAGHGRGLTCCQEDLTIRRSELTQRIDQVFTRNHIAVIQTQLVGDALVPNVIDNVGYWPSDHAAVESQLQVGSLP